MDLKINWKINNRSSKNLNSQKINIKNRIKNKMQMIIKILILTRISRVKRVVIKNNHHNLKINKFKMHKIMVLRKLKRKNKMRIIKLSL